MKRWYKVLCVWVVIALALSGLAPTVAVAQEPQGATESQYVPPRPDLMAVLQQQDMLPGVGKGLDAAASPKAVEAAYREYLAKKLGGGAFRDSAVQRRAGGAKLQNGLPPRSRILVVLVDYADLAHNNIPKPGSENNTDTWVSDFSRSYYQSLFFGTSPGLKSLANYISEATDGAWVPQGQVVTWTQVAGNAAVYGNDLPSGGVDNDLSDGADVYQLVKDAVDSLVASGYTPPEGWDDYASEDNVLDYFVIVHAGKGQESGGGAFGDDAVWSVQGALTTTYAATTTFSVKNFVVVAEDSPVGTIVHEMGHLFGLPDTWNPPDGLEVPGTRQRERTNAANVGEPSPAFWDPMAYGCWLGMPLGSRPASMTAWERIELGWLTNYRSVTLQDMPASIYLAQLETPSLAAKALKIELTPRVYVAPHSGDYMQQAPDPNDVTSPSILSHTFQITASTSAELRFWHWYDLETNLDVGYVEVASPSGGAYTTVFTVTGSSSGWAQRTINLNAYLGQTIDVRFRLERDPHIKKLGWFLDDFSLIQDYVTTWSDDGETSDGGPAQGDGDYEWQRVRFPRMEAYVSEHYYLLEWRNDQAGFDIGLREAYHMTDMTTGKADYFKYNPGLLIWYVNPIYDRTWGDKRLCDNDVLLHPGEGFLLAVDSHPDPFLQSTGVPWRSRVQMQDATFRKTGTTYVNQLHDSVGVLRTMGGLPAVPYFLDWWSSYPYWRSSAPDNSAKTPEYGVRVEVVDENADLSGAVIRFSIDAADMRTSSKLVDKATATPGEVLEYTIVLTNTGHADALTIVVSDTAPAHTTYIPGSYTVSGSPSWSITENNGIRWQGTVSLTHPVTITFRVLLDSVIDNGTVVENVAHVYEGDVPEVDLYARTTIVSQPCLTSSKKESNPSSVLAGDIVTYTIVLINTGSSGGTVILTDCMPVCTSYVSGSFRVEGATQWSGGYNPQTNCIHWTGYVPALGSTPVVTITFQALVSRGVAYCTLIQNCATINDGFQAPFNVCASTTVLKGPNLRESFKQVDKSVAAPGERLRYTVIITNTGNQSASVMMTDTIPTNTSYVGGSLSCSGGTCTTNGSVVTYTASLGAGAMGVVAFSVDIAQPLASGTIITNTANIVENGSKTYRREVTTTVLSEPRLTNSVKTVTNTSVGYGGILTYTITLLNDGTEDATVTITDAIPAGTQYIPDSLSYTSGSGGYQSPSGPITWTGTIARGDSVIVSFAVSITLTGTGVITNCALINDGVHAPFYRCAETRIAAIEVVSPTQEVYCGDLIDVPIRVVDVWDLQGYQVEVKFDPSILQIQSILEGTWFVPRAYFNYTYSNTAGTSLVYAALNAQPTGKSGTGTLYTIRFRAVGSGSTRVEITGSLLSNTPSPGFSPIPHNTVPADITINDRSVQGYAYLQGRSDHSGATVVALVGTTPVVTTTTDASGFYSLCPPTGSGQNFTIRITKRAYLKAERLVTVPPTGTLVLNTVTLLGGDPAGGNYTVTTTAPCTATWTCGGVPDGRVNVMDLTFVGARFLKRCGDREWEWEDDPLNDPDNDYCAPCSSNAELADINEDCVVDIRDLVLVGINFGKIAPSPWP